MLRALKIGLLTVAALLVVSVLTLRVTGLEPRYIDPASAAFAEAGRTAWPGLWLKGEVVREPVTEWDWTNQVNDPIRGNSIMLETRTWYGIPHSVTINLVPLGDTLYISGSQQDSRVLQTFPEAKSWWANIERDPRIRMKIDGKLYEMTAVLLADRAEIVELFGRDPVTRVVDSDGNEQITSVRHYWRVYQRNIPEY
jgi:hypothetical protein